LGSLIVTNGVESCPSDWGCWRESSRLGRVQRTFAQSLIGRARSSSNPDSLSTS
jgi:hypothetical protein